MKRWGQPNRDGFACIGTVDSYDAGQIGFLTHILTSGEVRDPAPSVTRAMAIAVLQSMPADIVPLALEALASIELGDEGIATNMPAIGNAIMLAPAVGNHDLMPLEFDDDG